MNLSSKINNAVSLSKGILVGKEDRVKLAFACLFAQGHLLIEDIPGVGKTTLALFLAKCLGFDLKRIQLTSDLLPADITGNMVFRVSDSKFELYKGPIFSNIVLADELNRATAKTQSAFLQAMEERKVSIDKDTYDLDIPFWVIATQNPNSQKGTFPLPESQLERFLMHLDIGFPDVESEKQILKSMDPKIKIDEIKKVFEKEDILNIFKAVENVHTSDELISYIQRLLSYTRNNQESSLPLSPRTGVDIVKASKSWAFLEGRDYVLPDDVITVFPYVVRHRIVMASESATKDGHFYAQKIIEKISFH